MTDALFVLYVADQPAAAAFWRAVLDRAPVLDVPGMTEFAVTGGASLGLMPAAGINRLLPELPEPAATGGPPRAEVYLRLADPQAAIARAIDAGATLVDEYRLRDWGDHAGYLLDPDGHVLAIASRGEPGT